MDVTGKRVTVVGMGRTAVALVRLLVREGASPFVTEAGPRQKLEPFCKELDELGVPYECGGHTGRAFDGTDLVVPSPGVPPGIPVIAEARGRGVDLVGEMELASTRCRSRVIAVTGTNGKTTTTELLKALIGACGHTVLLAGNNDFPFSAAVMADPVPEYIVLEVSSYQLETARTFRPWIGAVLNVTPDHLARHGTVESYAGVKARMFSSQGPDDHTILNDNDPYVRAMGQTSRAHIWRFSLDHQVENGLWTAGKEILERDRAIAHVSDVPLPGRHNLENALAALTVIRAGGFAWEKALAGLRSFKGVEHRIEFVTAIDGVDFYNDSKSTNIDSLKVALDSFNRPIVLIAGGEGKGADYRVLRDLVHQHVAHLVTMGQDAPLLEKAFGDVVPVRRVPDMAGAVREAASIARAGDVVLLSPACASFDMFENFEHRGRVFKAAVASLAEERSQAGGHPGSCVLTKEGRSE